MRLRHSSLIFKSEGLIGSAILSGFLFEEGWALVSRYGRFLWLKIGFVIREETVFGRTFEGIRSVADGGRGSIHFEEGRLLIASVPSSLGLIIKIEFLSEESSIFSHSDHHPLIG